MEAKELHKALDIVSGVTRRRSVLPILSHVLFEQNGSTVITATDLETSVRYETEATGEYFQATVPARPFMDVARNASNEILMALDNNRLIGESGAGEFELATMDACDFPSWGTVKAKWTVDVPIMDLVDQLSNVLNAAENKDEWRNLNTIFLDGKNGCLVGTDGHRLAKQPVDWLDDSVNVMVPRDSAKEIVRIFKKLRKESDTATITYDLDRNMLFESGPVQILVRLVDGEYPDYQQVIGKQPNEQATFDRKDFVQALKTVKPGLPRDAGISLTFADNGVYLVAENADHNGPVSINAKQCPGKALTWNRVGGPAKELEAQVYPENGEPYVPSIKEYVKAQHFLPGTVPDSLVGKSQIFDWRLLRDAVKKGDTLMDCALNGESKGQWFNGIMVMPMRGDPIKPRVPTSTTDCGSSNAPKIDVQPKEDIPAPKPLPAKRTAKPVELVKRPAKRSSSDGAKTKTKTRLTMNPNFVPNPNTYTHKKTGQTVKIGERDGQLYRWFDSYTRKDGVHVRGHWRKVAGIPKTVH